MLTYRYANENDCGKILEFIKSLAAYEKMSDEVVATEDLLREWIFEKKKAEVLFACEDGKEKETGDGSLSPSCLLTLQTFYMTSVC